MKRVLTSAVLVVLVAVGGAVVLAACGGDDDGDGSTAPCTYMGQSYREGDEFPAGDNCNACTCLDGSVVCTDVLCFDSGVPDAAGACAPTQGCAQGPACGGLCCDTGERCEN